MPRPVPRLAAGPVAALLALALAAVAAVPGHAQDQTRFDVLFRGLPVAQITVAARDDGASYAVAGRVRSTGIAAVFARVRFDMQAEGRWGSATPLPRRYAEDVDTGRRVSAVELGFAGGMPQVLRQAPAPDQHAVPAAEAAGTVDPLSALWRLARGGPREALCAVTLPVYDGARRSELVLGPAEGSGPVVCRGRYTRLAGFPPEDMAERTTFPFTVTYVLRGGQFVLTEVEAASLLGPIRIVRRD